MLKRLIVTACACTIAIPAVAIGGPPPDPEYGGKIENKENRYLGFDVKGSGNDKKISNGFIINLPFKCNDPMNNEKESGTLEKPIKVKSDGSFDDTKQYDFDSRGGASGIRYRLKGELDGNKATGFLDVELLGTGGCKSGKQDFKVKKPSPPVPATTP